MTQDNDILAKFKLISDSILKDSKSQTQKGSVVPDIYEGFGGSDKDSKSDLFNSFLKSATQLPESKENKTLNYYEVIEKESEKQQENNFKQENKKERFNFLQRAINKLFSSTITESSKSAAQFVSSQVDKKEEKKKDFSNIFSNELAGSTTFLGDTLPETSKNQQKQALDYSLMSKIAKISVNQQTYSMEDIIRSKELSNSELQKLFVNYVDKSVQEQSSTEMIEKIAADSTISDVLINAANGDVNRTQLEEVFVDFINSNDLEKKATEKSLLDAEAANVVLTFAAAINPDYMTREELEELFIRFCRNLSVNNAQAFKELADILGFALPNAFVQEDGLSARVANVVSDFRAAINPEFMTRAELEEIFIRFVREISIANPDAWAEMQQILSNAVAYAFSPDVSMDDESRAAIAGFSQAIDPQNMTRETLEELFTRFARQVSIKFPAAWAELQGMLSVALGQAYLPDMTMDDQSRGAIAGFSQAINPEMMTRETLEELFTRFARQVSVKFPAAWAELQGMLSVALGQAFELDITMDDASRSAIAGFSMAINPDFMKREQLNELFIRFMRQVSVQFPAAIGILIGILNQALPNAYTEPIPDMDDHSFNVISSFEQTVKPDMMTRDELETIFAKFIGELSSKFPSAHALIRSMLNTAIAGAYEPDMTMDDASRSAIAGFSQAIKPEFMTRDTLEELFTRYAREISVKFPAAWAEMQGMLSVALGQAYQPDITMDDASRSAIAGFSQAIKPEVMTRETLEELFTRFSREISVKFPAAWAEMQGMLSVATANAFIPDISMDDASRSAIVGFSQVIKPEVMTRETLEELFVRFSREISVKFPAAWAEMQGMLSVALGDAFQPDTTMDDSSRSAIAGFAQAVKPDVMTREDIEELFIRFAREISIKFPAAWAEMQGMLSVSVANSFIPDTTMDDSSRAAIAGLDNAIKPDIMTRVELETLFLRFSREISVKFPAAWSELQALLNDSLPYAFEPDTSMDDSSKSAIAGFALVIKPDIMTREELETLFLRFSKEISINFPAAWASLQGMLSDSLPHAFVPDETMDDATRNLVGEFETIITNREFTEDQLESVFADYLRQVPLMFPVVKSIIETKTRSKRSEAESKDKVIDKDEKDFINIDKEFKRISQDSKILDLKAQELSKELKAATNKEDIKDIQDQLRKIQTQKGSLDKMHSTSVTDISSNIKATESIKDDYVQELNLSFEKKDDRDLYELHTDKMTNWDMLRTLRREEVLGVMDELPKEHLIEALHVIPKHLLKQALVQLPVEDMCRVLFNARFPEALLRAMPRSKAIELLPSADQMLPILMTMGKISGFRNGCDLLEEVITKSLKVEPEQNPTRSQEEMLPFVEEQLIGKTGRNADALHPVQGKQSPIQNMIKGIEAGKDSFKGITEDKALNEEKYKMQGLKKELLNPEEFNKLTEDAANKRVNEKQSLQDKKLELKYQRPESLMPKELKELAQETIDKFGKEEAQQVLAAKRGAPEQMLELLESMKKVKDLASAKMAVSVLSVSQAKTVAKAALPLLETKHLVKISQFYGSDNKEMVKQMPRYSIEGLVKGLPKHYMIQGFKLLDKSMITGLLKTQSSQTIARVASEMLSRDSVKDTAFKKQGFV